MTHLEFYKNFKNSVSKVKLWLDMLGKQYYGGIGRVVNFKPGPIEIYYQRFHGEPNYHTVPSEFNSFIQEVLLEKSQEILQEAFVKMQQHQKVLAQRAVQEYNSVVEDIQKEI